jgi:hypothetical protein
MKARHGFQIIERRDGHRINHYRLRPTNQFDVVKVRILGLARDIRLKHLPERVFEVWDGIDAICRMKVKSDGSYAITPYLLQPIGKKEENLLEDDYRLSIRNRKENQVIGRRRGDTTAWLKAEPLDRVPCRIVEKSSWVAREKTVSRKFGS